LPYDLQQVNQAHEILYYYRGIMQQRAYDSGEGGKNEEVDEEDDEAEDGGDFADDDENDDGEAV